MAELPVHVAVTGVSNASDQMLGEAEAAGRRLAEMGAIVVTGGRGGVMEAASRGAIAFARAAGKPVFGVGSWELGADGVIAVESGTEAAERAVAAATRP